MKRFHKVLPLKGKNSQKDITDLSANGSLEYEKKKKMERNHPFLIFPALTTY